MNYDLSQLATRRTSLWRAVQTLWPLIAEEKYTILAALCAVVINAGLSLLAPWLIAHTIDTYLTHFDYTGVIRFSILIFIVYILALVANYIQIRLMGGVGQRMVFRLRDQLFTKLQSLPIAFFNQNKAGDLISRINNDTDKINQFFSQSLVQFFGNIFIMVGAALFLVSLNMHLGLATLAPAVVLFFITVVLSAWVKQQNLASAQSLGGMSSEIQESLNNFKVIIAFNRRDYFKQRFQEVNTSNYAASIKAGVANNTFTPLYGLASNIGQLIVLVCGIALITHGQFTIGLLIGFLSYASSFYNPLRQIAALWANFQTALASWDRVHDILLLENDLFLARDGVAEDVNTLLEFRGVSFGYPDSTEILHHIDLSLERGKIYALVGPTGGGKTTTASLMARLYDPTKGIVLLEGRDIRTYSDVQRTQKIGFILQDPVLFSGTVRENILYGNAAYAEHSNAELEKELRDAGLEVLLSRFDAGLETRIIAGGDAVSLGQKQLIAFIRAVLRHPELLILDEATANIDTVTEQLLEDILERLSARTTKVIIAHRLNTIQNADEIFFVNAGDIVKAGSMEHAVDMLLHRARKT